MAKGGGDPFKWLTVIIMWVLIIWSGYSLSSIGLGVALSYLILYKK